MTRILALDSSTDACSAALINGDVVLHRYADAPRAHTQLLLPMVDELLLEAGLRLVDLDAIAFGRGPGSFTGIRIAASMAQGLAFSANKPMLPVSTLAALAQGALSHRSSSFACGDTDTLQPQMILAAIDARMAEIYWAIYRIDDDKLVTLVGEEQLSAPTAITFHGLPEHYCFENVYGAGNGWHYADAIPVMNQIISCYPQLLPSALHIARLAVRDFANGLAKPADDALPVYLRDKVAWQNG